MLTNSAQTAESNEPISHETECMPYVDDVALDQNVDNGCTGWSGATLSAYVI